MNGIADIMEKLGIQLQMKQLEMRIRVPWRRDISVEVIVDQFHLLIENCLSHLPSLLFYKGKKREYISSSSISLSDRDRWMGNWTITENISGKRVFCFNSKFWLLYVRVRWCPLMYLFTLLEPARNFGNIFKI